MDGSRRRGSGRCFDDGPVERKAAAGDDRPRSARDHRDQRLARPGPGAAVGDLGSPPRRSVRRRRRLDRAAAEARTRRGDRRAGAQLPARLRAWQRRGDRRLGGPRAGGGPRGARAASSCAVSEPRTARSWSTCRACRCPTRGRRRRCASCRPGTRRCWSTPAARRSSPSATGRGCSARRRRSRSRPSSSNGRVAGTWRYEKGRVAIEPFERLDERARARVDEEAERLAAFHG